MRREPAQAAREQGTWLIEPTAIDPAATPVVTSAPIVIHDPATGKPINTTITISLYKIP